MAQKVGLPPQKLAGKRDGRPVMRNGKATQLRPRRSADDTSSAGSCNTSELDRCSIHDQRMDALEKGNAVRFDRKDVRKQLQCGKLDFDTFLDELPNSCAKIPVVKVLKWLPNIGEKKARAIVARLPLPTNTIALDLRIGELPARARYQLSGLVHRHIDGTIYWDRAKP